MKEGMVEDLFDCRAFGGVKHKDPRDQILGWLGDGNTLRETVLNGLDSLVSLLDLRGLKRWLTNDHGIQDYTERPNIYLEGMSLLLLENLRSDIVRRSTHRPPLLLLELQLSSQTEVASFYLHLLGEEQVAELEVSMNDPVLVHVLDGLQYLLTVALDLELREPLTPLNLLVECRVAAQFHHDVDILVVFKKVFELDNIGVVHGAMDFDLTLQLVLGTRLL